MNRRRIDAAVAAALALVVIAAGVAVWWGSDARATTLVAAADPLPEPAEVDQPPAGLTELWHTSVDSDFGAVATPYGSVVVGSLHSVVGLDAANGDELWRYTRSNRELCAIGSGDWNTDALSSWTGVHGVFSIFAKNGYCSQVTLHDPTTGERLYQRTGPGSEPGKLIFGAPYAGWFGSDYLELWRHDLVATIRYGNQPNPVNAEGPHLGCTILDAATATEQLATVERCADGTNLVLNWPTPSDAPGDHGWDANHTEPKATVPLGDVDAVVVGVTADRVAVLTGGDMVGFDATGTEVSRTPVHDAPDSVHPGGSRTFHDLSLTYVDPILVVTSVRQVEVPDPEAADGQGGDTADGTTEPATVAVDDPVLSWAADAIGLPAMMGGAALVPVPDGYEVRDLDTGEVTGRITVDRGGYSGRVDATAVGGIVIEVRGDTAVALAASF